jgi:2-iminobutanoate/2-iminopropanoate deaminase
MSFRFLETDRAPKPMGPYSSGVAFGGMVVTAGQLPIDPASGEIVKGGIEEQTRQCIRNLQAVLEAGGTTLDHVVKLTVFLTSMDDLPAVASIRREFWQPPHPVSTTVEANRLANPNALIEIDVLAVMPE